MREKGDIEWSSGYEDSSVCSQSKSCASMEKVDLQNKQR